MPRTAATARRPGRDRRGYGQFCGLARALDVVGERWTLLVVRELLTGPKRFSDLLESLPGLSTSLLTVRLRTMEADGLVARHRLPPPAASAVYLLSPRGHDLGEVVKRLAVWGLPLLDGRVAGDVFRPSWLAFYADTVGDLTVTRGMHDIYEFQVAEDTFHVAADDGHLAVREGPSPRPPDVLVRCSMDTFAAIGLGHTTVAEATAAGAVEIEGSPEAVARCLAVFTPRTTAPADDRG